MHNFISSTNFPFKYTPVDNERNPNQPLWRLLSGATAGVVANSLTHPLDVVRARLTVQDISSGGVIKYKGISHAVKTMAREEGFRALFKGILSVFILFLTSTSSPLTLCIKNFSYVIFL